MLTILRRWLIAARRRQREKALVRSLLALNDHLLADIGLRRDQLQPDGIHELDVTLTPARPQVRRSTVRPTVLPSLQGCG